MIIKAKKINFIGPFLTAAMRASSHCNYLSKRLILIALLLIIRIVVPENRMYAQSIYDSIVVEYFLSDGSDYYRFTLLPEVVNDYHEYKTPPAIHVECTENRTTAIRKHPGTGFVYMETRNKDFTLKNDFLIDDTSGESYFDRLMSLAVQIRTMDGNIWLSKSGERDSVVEGYAICRIIYYDRFTHNRMATTKYQFEHYTSDVFREEYRTFVAILKKIIDIPNQYMPKKAW